MFRDVVVVDVEGNGGSPPALVELAVTAVSGLAISQTRSWLVKPPQPITPIVRRIHGISNSMVMDCGGSESIAEEVAGLLSGAWVVGHNVGVDAGVLRREFPLIDPAGVIDTLALARAVWPQAPSFRLHELAAWAGVTGEVRAAEGAGAGPRGRAAMAHSAGYDSVVAAKLYVRLIQDPASRPLEAGPGSGWDRKVAIEPEQGAALF